MTSPPTAPTPALASAAAPGVLPLLALANFSAACAGMLIAGLLQLISQDLRWTPAQAGHLITLYALGFAVGAPLLGAWLAQQCRKVLVVRGLLLVAAGSLGTAFAPASPWIEIARLVVAAGAALTLPGTSAIAAFLFPQDRPRALARVVMGLTAAIVLGVPLGTLAADALGWRAAILMTSALAVFGAAMVKWRLPGGIVVPPVPLSAWPGLLRDPAVLRLFGVTTAVVGGSFAVYAFIATFASSMAGLGARELSGLLFAYGLTSFAASAVLDRVVGWRGEAVTMAVALVALSCTLAALALTAHRPWLLAALFVLWSVASTFFGTLQQSRVVGAAPALGPATLALNTSATFLGQAIGTLAGGVALTAWGVGALPWVGAGLVGVGCVLAWRRGG